MKTSLFLAFILFTASSMAQEDSLARIAARVINDERRRIGIDTLEYEADTFCFATDWADSTNRYFHVEGNIFSRKAAHRNCKNRMIGYERAREKEWKHFAECLGTGPMKESDIKTVFSYANGLLGSHDHYEVLMKKEYEKIIIGILIDNNRFSIVVFTTTEWK